MRLQLALPSLVIVLAVAASAPADCPEMIVNGTFSDGTTGWSIDNPGDYASLNYEVIADAYNPGNDLLHLDIVAYSEPWQSDVEMNQGVSLTAGNWYRLTFWARSDSSNTSVPVQIKIGETVDPYTPVGLDEDVTFAYNAGDGSNHELEFQAEASGDFGLVFLMGLETTQIWIDSVSLVDLSSPDCSTGGTGGSGGSSGSGGTGGTGGSGGSSGSGGTGGTSGSGGSGGGTGSGGLIAHNQLGYLPNAEKVATLIEASSSPVSWELLDDEGSAVASGETVVSGNDPPSGHHVHLIDFSDYEGQGSGFRLSTGVALSSPFSIGGVYAEMRKDALRFFYHQRSSEALAQPYAGGSAYVRSAGHTDTTVSCFDGSCSYQLDTTGGWYDAGDYGKYVVNGGIALWTLLNLYERTMYLGTDLSALGDDISNIPESGNGISDLLDEAEKEVRFLLGMQVPEGESFAGMAHHKVHSDEWDPVPVTPASAGPHKLHPPSTAATLNLAATAAQCARVFAQVNPGLADDCLDAATTAYEAAKQHPQRYAPSSDDEGGGAYSDSDVSDEFYWAAAELFVTTGEPAYAQDLVVSEHHAAPPEGAAFSWPTTATLGMLSLAIVPNGLSSAEVEALRAALVLRAQADLVMAQSGYGAATDGYYWGSNGVVLNSGLLQAVAYDLTGSPEHRAAALASLDYVLGRNPLHQSYVSGYGVSPFENAHHRFWANAFDVSWPKPPPGVLAGGPNENLDGLTSETVSSLGLSGCAPSTCWSDYEGGYSMTEVTVNWNAPLAWLASWAHEQETDPQTSFPGVDLDARPGEDPVPGSGGSPGAGGSGGAGGSSGAGGSGENGGSGGGSPSDSSGGAQGDGGNQSAGGQDGSADPGNTEDGGDDAGGGDDESEDPGEVTQSGGCSIGSGPNSWASVWVLLVLLVRWRRAARRPVLAQKSSL